MRVLLASNQPKFNQDSPIHMVCCDKFSVFPFLRLHDIQPKFKPGVSHINGLLW